MMKIFEELPENKSKILIKYQQIAKIKTLRSILVDNTDIKEIEKQYKLFIEKTFSEKNSNTEQLASLLNQHNNQQKYNFNLTSALKLKEEILNSIKKINLFDPNISNNHIPIKLLKSKLSDQDTILIITNNNNNQQQVITSHTRSKVESEYYEDPIKQVFSNVVLQKDIKYIFRLQIQFNKPNDNCYIGLMQNSSKNYQPGCLDNLSCILKNNENQKISIGRADYLSNVQKGIKGDVGQFVLSSENEIEMRVCLKDQILEILDYPHYRYQIALNYEFKPNLIKYSNLRLYIGVAYKLNSVTLKEALTVERFE